MGPSLLVVKSGKSSVIANMHSLLVKLQRLYALRKHVRNARADKPEVSGQLVNLPLAEMVDNIWSAVDRLLARDLKVAQLPSLEPLIYASVLSAEQRSDPCLALEELILTGVPWQLPRLLATQDSTQVTVGLNLGLKAAGTGTTRCYRWKDADHDDTMLKVTSSDAGKQRAWTSAWLSSSLNSSRICQSQSGQGGTLTLHIPKAESPNWATSWSICEIHRPATATSYTEITLGLSQLVEFWEVMADEAVWFEVLAAARTSLEDGDYPTGEEAAAVEREFLRHVEGEIKALDSVWTRPAGEFTAMMRRTVKEPVKKPVGGLSQAFETLTTQCPELHADLFELCPEILDLWRDAAKAQLESQKSKEAPAEDKTAGLLPMSQSGHSSLCPEMVALWRDAAERSAKDKKRLKP